jgi:hypothetical protein
MRTLGRTTENSIYDSLYSSEATSTRLPEEARVSGKGFVAAVVVAGVFLGVPGQAGASALTPQSTTTTTATNPSTDRATAEAINLTGTDLPGWQESPNPTNTSDQGLNNKITACVGGSPGKNDVAKASSPNFDKGTVRVSSQVTIVRSHADGLADLRIIKGPKVPSCFKKVLRPLFATQLPKGAAISKLKVSMFTPTESIPNSFGMRMSFTITAKHQGETLTVPVTLSEITFLVGRVEVSLDEDQKGQPSPVAVEPALIHTLSTRAGGSVQA